MASPVEEYLVELRCALRHDPLLARRVLEEAADHLAEIVAAERRSGMSRREAEEAAVRRFGSAGALARDLDRFSLPLKALLALATAATVLVAAWLFFVVARVLPARDPAHIPMWRTVAFAFLAYSGLCIAYLIQGPRRTVLRWTVLPLSVAAVGLGAYAVVRMIHVADVGGHFEGYLVLMGLILAGHGLTAILHTVVAAAIARRVRSQ
ncbi:MAG: permease prefix domain 1-containing protein [bacterium]